MTAQPIEIRHASEDDSDEVSQLIIRTLRSSSAKEYSAAIIANVELSFSPSSVQRLMAKRKVFVASDNGRIVGTGSLDGKAVRMMFVLPEFQGRGIGTQLMQRIEALARENGVDVLTVPSSITAVAFYGALGFKFVHERWHGKEKTLVMELDLRP